MNQFLKLSVVMATFTLSHLCFAGTSLHVRSARNDYTGSFIEILSTKAKQGIYDAGSSNPNHLMSDLGRRALKSGLPVRHEERSTGGYSPYKATIVTLAKTADHLVELDMDSDLGFSARIIVTSLLPSLSEVTVSTDSSGPAALLSIRGPLVSALKEALVKLNAKETEKGVLSLNGMTKTIYDAHNREKTDMACGTLLLPTEEFCIVYLN